MARGPDQLISGLFLAGFFLPFNELGAGSQLDAIIFGLREIGFQNAESIVKRMTDARAWPFFLARLNNSNKRSLICPGLHRHLKRPGGKQLGPASLKLTHRRLISGWFYCQQKIGSFALKIHDYFHSRYWLAVPFDPCDY